jgi:hypothetical protein
VLLTGGYSDNARLSTLEYPHRSVTVDRTTIPERVATLPPSPDATVRLKGKGPPVRGADRNDIGQVRNLDRDRFGNGGTVPQLTMTVFAPRPHGAVPPKGKAVAIAGGDGHSILKTADRNWIVPINLRPVPKLSLSVSPPSPNTSVGTEGYAMVLAHSDFIAETIK